jgi:hypothetical protein
MTMSVHFKKESAGMFEGIQRVKEEKMHAFVAKMFTLLGGIALVLGMTSAPAFAATTVPFRAAYSGSYTRDAANPNVFHLAGSGGASYLGPSTDVGTGNHHRPVHHLRLRRLLGQ